MRNLFLIIMLLFAGLKNADAQSSFKTIDSTSYALYQAQDWKELAHYGSAAIRDGYNYYYLNLRVGIAYFNLGDYSKAITYFDMAKTNNSNSEVANEYLFWCYFNLGYEVEAQEYYKELSDSVRLRMDYKPRKLVESIFLEGGIKFSGDQVAAKNLYYFNGNINHRFSPKFSIYQGYNYMQQEAIWGHNQQHQYIFNPYLNMKRNWVFGATFNLSNYKSYLDFSDSLERTTHEVTQMPGGGKVVDSVINDHYTYYGDYQQNALLTQINLAKQAGTALIAPHYAYYAEWINPNYYRVLNSDYLVHEGQTPLPPTQTTSGSRSDSTSFDQRQFAWQHQIGVAVDNTFFGHLTLGADVNFVAGSGYSRFNVSPYFKYKFGRKVVAYGYYMKKGNYVLSMFGGKQFFNSYDQINAKISLTTEFVLSRRMNLYTTYQFEKITDNLSLRTYQFNSVFIGLKFKL